MYTVTANLYNWHCSSLYICAICLAIYCMYISSALVSLRRPFASVHGIVSSLSGIVGLT